jgi:SUN domain-containing protein 1/2
VALEAEVKAELQQEKAILETREVVNGVTVEELQKVLKDSLHLASRREGRELAIQQVLVDTLDQQLDELPPLPLPEVETSSPSKEISCVTMNEAISEVQKALYRHAQDGIGLGDFVQKGSFIVHALTSPTYHPPPEQHQRLGSVWWRKYIPEDIESWLPSSWVQWDARLPTSLWDAMGARQSSATAPPEAVLQIDTLPGACWPMQGSSGHVTLALTSAVYVNAISIDHAHNRLLLEQERQLQSAPRRLKIVGYPPCRNNNTSTCGGYPFQVSDPIVLLDEVIYDIYGAQTQTFVLSDYRNDDEATCAATSDSCSAPPSVYGSEAIAAIQVQIMDNWGNSDYTCLYRVRVHGEAVDL